MKKVFLTIMMALAMVACTTGKQSQGEQTSDASVMEVFEEAYYYMSTPERDSIWALVPEDSLVADSHLSSMHDAFLMEQQTAVGMSYTDFSAPMPMGGELSLSNLVGKTEYVLIDFWASWCPPCRALMPALKELYASLPEGKLEILGVSLDNDSEAWVGAIERMDLPWAHMSDLAGWQCAPANQYGVFCIPTLVLINREGIIIARGCDEEAVLAHIR